VRGCSDASHLFLGCVKVFFAFFDIDGAVSLVLPVRTKLRQGLYHLWACGACCCCALVGEKRILDHFVLTCCCSDYQCTKGTVQNAMHIGTAKHSSRDLQDTTFQWLMLVISGLRSKAQLTTKSVEHVI
jgi:hypothetical protein